MDAIYILLGAKKGEGQPDKGKVPQVSQICKKYFSILSHLLVNDLPESVNFLINFHLELHDKRLEYIHTFVFEKNVIYMDDTFLYPRPNFVELKNIASILLVRV